MGRGGGEGKGRGCGSERLEGGSQCVVSYLNQI